MRVACRLCLLILSFVIGCERKPATVPAGQREPVGVIASVYALADVARQVGGERVRTDWVVESGQSLAAVQMTPELHTRLRSAELVLTAGEGWATHGFDNPYQMRRFVRLDTMPSAEGMPPGAFSWLDPVVVREAGEQLATRLGQLRPRERQQFLDNQEAYAQQLDRLLEGFSALADREKPAVLVLGRQWDPLLERAGFEGVWEFDASAMRLTDSQIRRLRQLANQRGAGGLVVSADTPASVLRDLENRTQLPLIPLDAFGTSAAAGRSTYVQIMTYNLEQLRRVAEGG